jgi:hypothetical protein
MMAVTARTGPPSGISPPSRNRVSPGPTPRRPTIWATLPACGSLSCARAAGASHPVMRCQRSPAAGNRPRARRPSYRWRSRNRLRDPCRHVILPRQPRIVHGITHMAAACWRACARPVPVRPWRGQTPRKKPACTYTFTSPAPGPSGQVSVGAGVGVASQPGRGRGLLPPGPARRVTSCAGTASATARVVTGPGRARRRPQPRARPDASS